MKPAPFDYRRVDSVEEAIAAIGEAGDEAVVLSGGQSLVPMMSMRLVRPSVVVDINRIVDLEGISESADGVGIGALTRYATVEDSPFVAARVPLLPEAVRYIGDRHIRNRGTIGGSVAHADPSGEVPLAACVLDATVALTGPEGKRLVPASEFFIGPYMTAREPDELVTEVVFRDAIRTQAVLLEHVRRHGDFAVLAVVTLGEADNDGRWHDVRVGMSGVGPGPLVVDEAARLLDGTRLEDEVIQDAAQLCVAAAMPRDDVRASAAYREHLIPIYVRRALTQLRTRGELPG